MNVGLRTADALFVALLTVAIPACSTGSEAPPHDHDVGTAYLQQNEAISTQQAKLLASDGATFDLSGLSVAVSGNTALVGSSRNDDKGTDAGAVYVFVRSGTSWIQQAKLTADDAAANDSFGITVALSGDTALIGAKFDDNVASDAGAAYIFVRTGTSWAQQAKLVASDAAAADQLGASVALEGDTAVVGTIEDDDHGDRSGSAYVFVRSGTSWTQQAKLTPTDGATADQFGVSVSVSGNTAVVGTWGDDDLGNSSGSAYVFVRSGTSWTQQAKLLAGDGAAADQFGVSVSVSGDTALIGANLDDDDAHGSDAGSAYVFVRSGTTWTQQAKLTATDGAGGDNFGDNVALQGDTALLGVPFDSDLGAQSGSAYVFVRSGTHWTQQAKLLAGDGASADLFGVSVALSGNTALIGALGHDDLGSSSGATYVFTSPQTGSTNGAACATNAECGSGFCTDGVCCDTACGGGDPDDCQACSAAAGAAVDGTCAPRSAGIVCRAATGACDVAESCTGSSAACPADGMIAAGTVCRAAAGACDVAESCTGASAACPGNGFAAAGTTCRAAASSCDLTESCTGGSASCPNNAFKPDLSLCSGGLLGLPGLCIAKTCVL
jgi:hypothetical protein